LTTSVRGQPLRTAARKCARMCGYFAALKAIDWTPGGVVQCWAAAAAAAGSARRKRR
jgi:hypothetical protein